MDLQGFLFGAFIYLCAAVISAPIAKRLGLGSVLGYLLAGVVIGPSVLGFVGQEGADVMHFAEFGVIMMLFIVGLELQPEALWKLRRAIFGLGLLQVVGTAATIGAAAMFFGLDWRAGLACGLILAMSSTAIVLQSLAEKGTMKTPAGQSAFAVLLFQDIAVIPILALLPLLAISHGADAGHSTSLISGYPAWLQALCILGAVAIIIAAGRFVMQPLFRIIADTGTREIFVAFALLIVVGITQLMGLIGLSAALGTFLAGVVLADSEYRHELEMDLQPFKGLLLAVFFMAVGAGIDFSLFQTAPLTLLGLIAGFIAIKIIVMFLVSLLFKQGKANASMLGFSLGQGGEFGFVLITFAGGLGLISVATSSMLVAMIALSMALAPLLMMLDQKRVQPIFSGVEETRESDMVDHSDTEVIIAGHGRFGMTIGRLLNAQGKRSVVLDYDPSQVDLLRKFGFKVFYGDALRTDLLEAAGAKTAKILIIAIDDRQKIDELIVIAKMHFPHLELFVRAYDRAHAREILQAGVTHVYREVFGSSLDLAEDAMIALGKHPYEAARAAKMFRQHDEAYLRKAAEIKSDDKALVDLARLSRAEIANVFRGDREDQPPASDSAWHDSDGTSDQT